MITFTILECFYCIIWCFSTFIYVIRILYEYLFRKYCQVFTKRNKPTLSENGISLLHQLEMFMFIDSLSVWIEVIFYLGNYLSLKKTITRLSWMLQMHLKWMYFMLHQKLLFRNLPYQEIFAEYKLSSKINVTRRKGSTLWK